MSTVYATVNGIVRTSSEGAQVTPIPGGAKTTVIAEYEASALATASIIHCVQIPEFCAYRLRQINHDALGAGTSLIYGISTDTDQQLEPVSTVAAGVAPANAGGWKQTDVALDTYITTTGTMTGTIQVEVEYIRRAKALTF